MTLQSSVVDLLSPHTSHEENQFSNKKFDIVVFGASGFTGQFVVEELARTVDHFKWAIAGRDMQKLQAVLTTASKVTGKDLSDIIIIIADVNNESSLASMSQQANVVINCVGPYSLYGTAVVKACIENGSNHIDISGEPLWIEQTMLTYNKKAEHAGVYVLHACAFDSIPAEMGLLYTRKHFEGELNAVEVYDKIHFGSEGGSGNYGTWLSAIYGISQQSQLKAVRRQLYSPSMPATPHPLRKRYPVFYNSENYWEVARSFLRFRCIGVGTKPSFLSDYVQFKQYYCLPKTWSLYEMMLFGCIFFLLSSIRFGIKLLKKIQFKQYYCLPNLWKLFGMMLFGFIFFLLSSFRWGIKLLKKYPRLLSFGMFSHNGPTRKQIAQASFSMTFVGNGYPSKADDTDKPSSDLPNEKASRAEDTEKPHTDLPNKCIVTRVTGPEPGYAATPICVIQVAYTLLEERDKLPNRGGVLTPGAAFAETTLIDRLGLHGVHFAVVNK